MNKYLTGYIANGAYTTNPNLTNRTSYLYTLLNINSSSIKLPMPFSYIKVYLNGNLITTAFDINKDGFIELKTQGNTINTSLTKDEIIVDFPTTVKITDMITIKLVPSHDFSQYDINYFNTKLNAVCDQYNYRIAVNTFKINNPAFIDLTYLDLAQMIFDNIEHDAQTNIASIPEELNVIKDSLYSNNQLISIFDHPEVINNYEYIYENAYKSLVKYRQGLLLPPKYLNIKNIYNSNFVIYLIEELTRYDRFTKISII